MFILTPPYISDFLIQTIKKNKYSVLLNEYSNNFDIKDLLLSDSQAKKESETVENFKLYTNAENSIEWIMNNLKNTDYPEKIKIFKDKVLFRNLLKSIFPDFYYKEILFEDIKNINPASLKYPFILKPAVGFLSFGVYPVKNQDEFKYVLHNLDNDIKKFQGIFPSEVVNTSKFIIEEIIKGTEFAVDVYFSSSGEAVILNIFKHPFLNDKDVSDRVYYTSKDIIKKYLPIFQNVFNQIGEAANLKNFTGHIELRVDENNKVIPIEVNPMRFTGWCITDLAYFAYGINVYEYYMEEKRPNWNKILDEKGDELYYFICADTPSYIEKSKIKNINYKKFVSDLPDVIELRKQDFNEKPLFAIVFGKSNDESDINKILSMDLSKYIEM